MRYYFFFSLVLSIFATNAQRSQKLTVLFPNARATPQTMDSKAIVNFVRRFDSSRILKILIEGNTDNKGGHLYNENLSKRRANNVAYIIQNSFNRKKEIDLKYYGMENPIASNSTSFGRKINRRVDIYISYGDTMKNLAPVYDTSRHIEDLYAELKPASQTFCITNKVDTTITAKGGSIIIIKANCFNTKDNCTCINIIIDEAFSMPDIVSHNLSTSSNGQPLISGGMISIEANCEKEKLKLLPGKEMVVMTPTFNVNPAAGIFTGEWDKDNDIQWQKDTSATLSTVNAITARDCLRNLFGGGRHGRKKDSCVDYQFFFTGFNKWAKGIFNHKQRDSNRINRSCLRWERFIKKRMAQLYDSTEIKRRAKIDSMAALWKVNNKKLAYVMNECGQIFDMMDRSKIKDAEEFLFALENQIDSLDKGESKGVRSISDLQYYIFNKSNTGWSNVDWLMKITPKDMVDFTVSPPFRERFTDCKLLFKSQLTILEGIGVDGVYHFKAVPKGYSAYIIFFDMRGQSYFGYKEIVINKGQFNIDVNPMTAKEIRVKLEEIEKGRK